MGLGFVDSRVQKSGYGALGAPHFLLLDSQVYKQVAHMIKRVR
jgi:hypothetical protein